MNDKIKELQKQIEIEENKIKNCKHVWGETISNSEIKKEPYGNRMLTQGVHFWYEPEGYKDVKIPRWTRKCLICEKEEHTYKQKPIITSYEADFS